MVSYMTTVSDRIAQEYSTNFGVRCEVMMNLPFYEDIEATLTSSEKIRMIHHGYATPHRRIENMINLMKHLDRRFELDLMMLGMESKYGCHLREVSLSNPRIRFVATVPMRDIVKTISVYDFGLYLLAPNTFNNRMALPNKIFEFIQGRLALAIWPSQEMVRIVKKYQNGVYSTDFNVREMAHVLNRLTNENILNMKRNSCIAANELNADNNRKQLLEIVGSLVTS